MLLKSKTFNIGESCEGGVITAEIHTDKIVVIGKEWDRSVGDSKLSDQSSAEGFCMLEVQYYQVRRGVVEDFLSRALTTSYYAGLINDWIEDCLRESNLY